MRSETMDEASCESVPGDPYRTDTYCYEIPRHLIAQQPSPERARSRLMAVDRNGDSVRHARFEDIADYLRSGDLLVVNNSKVFPARLLGTKASGGRVDLLLLRDVASDDHTSEWHCLVRSSRRPRKGQVFFFSKDLQGEVGEQQDSGAFSIRFNLNPAAFMERLERVGLTPLPPYIRRNGVASESEDESDRTRYQTVFAKQTGSVAAPTAGLHFTGELCQALEQRGIGFSEVTLHVGQATFLPIRTEDLRDHRLLPERFTVSATAAGKILEAKRQGRRVVAVGTTVVRCLESLATERGDIEPCEGMASLYIVPGYPFKLVDALITNFHFPGSSLLVLVSAFAGRQTVLKAYEEAIRQRYRFFSFGDGMLIQ